MSHFQPESKRQDFHMKRNYSETKTNKEETLGGRMWSAESDVVQHVMIMTKAIDPSVAHCHLERFTVEMTAQLGEKRQQLEWWLLSV